MSTFVVETTINAPVEKVWSALADIGAIYKWNPGVQDSHLTSEMDAGVETSRYCDLGGENYLYESVVKWEEDRALTMRIMKTNLPFKSADIRFTLKPVDGGTMVAVSPLYQIKYGFAGGILDRFYVRNTYEKGMENLLTGLKEFVEFDNSDKRSNEDDSLP